MSIVFRQHYTRRIAEIDPLLLLIYLCQTANIGRGTEGPFEVLLSGVSERNTGGAQHRRE